MNSKKYKKNKKLKYFFAFYLKSNKFINQLTSKMNASSTDCPICMDAIDVNKNCVTTECGHCFHASCLMTNISRNGFGCPYCRTLMAEEPDEYSETEDDVSENWSHASDEELYDAYALRGLRFMTNNLEGNEHDILDLHDEREDDEERERMANTENNDTNTPSAAYIAEKLVAQGITMEQLVKALLINHEEYDNNTDVENADSSLFGKMRIIISNYSPIHDEPAPPVPRPIEPVSVPIPSPCPAVAEPKTPTNNVVAIRHSVLAPQD